MLFFAQRSAILLPRKRCFCAAAHAAARGGARAQLRCKILPASAVERGVRLMAQQPASHAPQTRRYATRRTRRP